MSVWFISTWMHTYGYAITLFIIHASSMHNSCIILALRMNDDYDLWMNYDYDSWMSDDYDSWMNDDYVSWLNDVWIIIILFVMNT